MGSVGLTLANRGVLFGATTTSELVALAKKADASGAFDSVWVGDSLLGNPRLESVNLLSALGAVTQRVRLGTACMASFPVRDPVLLAAQWATVDQICQGRSALVACTGIIGDGAKSEAEHYGVSNKHRVERLIEGIQVVKALWTEDSVTFEGAHHRLSGVGIGVKPHRVPRHPVFIASNARRDPETVDRTLRRVARHADGWMSTILTPDPIPTWKDRWARLLEHAHTLGRAPHELDNVVYFNVHVNEDREVAFDEAKRFLDRYYGNDWPHETVEAWVAYGSPTECAERIRAWFEVGAAEVTLRLAAWDQMGQFDRVVREVLPSL